jgi:hypothetical protein
MEHVFSPKNQPFVGARLRSRLLIFFVGGIILLGIIGYDVYTRVITWEAGLLALAIGLIIGFVYGRLSRVRWHETSQQIVMQYDIVTYVIIAAYLLISYFRDILLSDYLSGAALEAVSLAVVAGVLIGRIFGLNIAIMKVLRIQKPSA